jgi:hypothetical protein
MRMADPKSSSLWMGGCDVYKGSLNRLRPLKVGTENGEH